LLSAGCRTLFRVRRLPAPIRYAGAVVRHGRQAEQARRLQKYTQLVEIVMDKKRT
jgi:hypothetical protein